VTNRSAQKVLGEYYSELRTQKMRMTLKYNKRPIRKHTVSDSNARTKFTIYFIYFQINYSGKLPKCHVLNV